MKDKTVKAILCDFDRTLFDTDLAMPFLKAKPKPDFTTAFAKNRDLQTGVFRTFA